MSQPADGLSQTLQTVDKLAQQTFECEAQFRRLQQEIVIRQQDFETECEDRRNHLQQQSVAQRQQIQQQAEQQQQQLQAQTDNDQNTLQANHDREHNAIIHHADHAIRKLTDDRQNEAWILQSVLDEDVENSPVLQFERASEGYVTQKNLLDEKREETQAQLTHLASYLSRCHASVEVTQPTAHVSDTQPNALQDTAVAAADRIAEQATVLRRLSLPKWISGGRIGLIGLMVFIVTALCLLPIKANPADFLDPALRKPNWEWAVISGVIALITAGFFCTMLMLKVKNRLRSEFDQLLQLSSNQHAATDDWNRRSQKSITKLETTAQEWREKLEAQRSGKLQALNDSIDQQISTLTANRQQKLEDLNTRTATTRQQIQIHLQTATQDIHQQREQALKDCNDVCDNNLMLEVSEKQRQLDADIRVLNQQNQQLLTEWSEANQSLRNICQQAQVQAAANRFWPEHLSLPDTMPSAFSVADVLIAAAKTPDADSPADKATRLCLEAPAVLSFPDETSLVVEHDAAGREIAISFLRRQMLKLLTTIPAGRIRLTLIDPIGLGQSFAAMMHLTDFDELLIHSRIYTDANQIREQLQNVTEHMENIFQTYLRSQFESIEEYNQSAGEVAEPYHFVVIAGFPAAFNEESARHLSAILTSGPRCGVHAMVAWNPASAAPPTFDIAELTNHCIHFKVTQNTVQPAIPLSDAVTFEAFEEPSSADYIELVRAAGELSKDARRVEVSFNRIAPHADEIWGQSSADGLDLPIGRAGAARLQFLRLGRGTSQHVLVAGKTGSGKSTLLHILITNMALHYGPDEVQFFLIDFKKGVEFRTYATHRLPHARVVAVESDREFGLSVLERLDEILQERGELFRERGVQDIPGFREAFSTEPMPRLLLLIDEFQEFFVAEDRVSSRASLLLDRLVRQGRAFGIHVILGSQTLGGAYSLARSTMGQIAVRIALQCSDNDAHLILSEDNTAARLLTRPGEAIYNDANGMTQGNNQFQIAWLDDGRRESAIETMNQKTDASNNGMIVFEGNVPPSLQFCSPLIASWQTTSDSTRRPTDTLPVWIGEPVAIAAPTSIELRQASGQNVLLVGQDERQTDGLLASVLLSLVRPNSKTPAPHIQLLHDRQEGDSVLAFERLRKVTESDFAISSPAEAESVVEKLHAELVAREADPEKATTGEQVLIVRNIGQFRSLRKEEDDFGLGGFGEPKAATPASLFGDLIKRGPVVGIHVIVWSDTFNNAVRWLTSSMLREFENRIAFRMNQTDSASLVDSPVAANMGPGRAILYRDQTGQAEKFRPFSWPDDQWLESHFRKDLPPNSTLDIDSLNIE